MKQKMLPRVAATGLMLALFVCISFVAWPQDAANHFLYTPSVGSGEREMKALAQAYPNRITQVEKRNGDWAVDVEGEWFFWAHGRILPGAERAKWRRYQILVDFHPYRIGSLPPIPSQLDSQAKARLKNMIKENQGRPTEMSEDFLNRLFDATSGSKIKSQLVTVDFLGFPVRVHRRIAGALQHVAAQCKALRRTNPQVASFLASLAHIEGFSYRDVSGIDSPSYHSYGLAVDLIPRSYHGKAVYWRWTWVMQKTGRWWATPYSQRWMVPSAIVSAFEKYGFVWGGKWLFFDNMHFEYRPEILILSKKP